MHTYMVPQCNAGYIYIYIVDPITSCPDYQAVRILQEARNVRTAAGNVIFVIHQFM